MGKVLITGISGFKGSHLAEYLLLLGQEVYGTIRWRSNTSNIDAFKNEVRLINADIRDASSMKKTIADLNPDYIFHLAAQSFVPESWHAPAECLYTNLHGTLNVLEAVRELKSTTVVVIAGSSEEYGLVYPHEAPIKETNPLRPLSPYGVSKVGADLLGRQYFRSYGMGVIVTRAFNTTGPRRGEVFATSSFAKQIAEIEAGLIQPVIRVGNLEAQRDLTDVRDTVKAYWLIANKGMYGEVCNICSGKAWSMREVLNMLLSLTKKEIKVETDPSRLRPSDVPLLLGDNTKLKEQTGWEPTIPFKNTMIDLLNYWRSRLGAKEFVSIK